MNFSGTRSPKRGASGPRNAGLQKVAQFGSNFKARFYQVVSLHVGQSSTRQLKAGLECGWPEEAHQDNNQKKRLYEGALDQNYPNISEFRIYLDRVKSNLTLLSPQVRRNHGRRCRVEFSGGTRADRLHDLVRDRCVMPPP